MKKYIYILICIQLLCACTRKSDTNKVVLCIPVYGQSLALGEEAERITDFDSLATYADGRIVTEELDHSFGYFDNDSKKLWLKKIIGYQKRAYELSVYQMARILTDNLGEDTLVCIFPGGQGATAISHLNKGTLPYQRFMDNIRTAYEKCQERGWNFMVPAICWMQGESDIVDYPNTDYRDMLSQMWKDMNNDILQITHQKDSIPFICYQANSLCRAKDFNAGKFDCRETLVPNAFVDLLRTDSHFWASGPTYPYSCVNEKIHIDAQGQQAIGTLAARSALGIIRNVERIRGLIPTEFNVCDNAVIISFNTVSTLSLDTIHVNKAMNYGFDVINKENKSILNSMIVDGSTVRLNCSESPIGCKVRYAVNGDYMKSGNLHGPRGNLRDAAGHWCYQFDLPLSDEKSQ